MRAPTLLLVVALLLALAGLAWLLVGGGAAPAPGPGPRPAESNGEPSAELRADDAQLSGARPTERASAGADAATEDVSTAAEEPAAEPAWPTALEGSVVDAESAPVAGARVVFLPEGGDPLGAPPTPEERAALPRAETDVAGTFRLEGLAPGERHALLVRHPEHLLTRVEHVVVGPSGTSVEPPIVLARGRELYGVVTDDADVPVEGAALVLDSGWNAERPVATLEELRATTDAEGRYRIAGVPDGRRMLTVRKEGYGTQTQVGGLEFSERIGWRNRADFRLRPSAPLAGVVQGAAGAPVAGVHVRALERSNPRVVPHGDAVTGPDGAFLVRDVHAGTYELRASADGWRTAVRRDVPAPTDDVLLELERWPAARGTVVSGDTGAPLASFRARLRSVAFPGTPSVPRGDFVRFEGAAGGAFELGGLAGGTWQVEAVAPGWAPSVSAPFECDGSADVDGIVVELRRGGALAGRVVDERGAPLAGARVEAREDEWVDDALTHAMGELVPTHATRRSATSGPDGRFRLAALAPADYQLRLSAPDRSETVRPGLEVREGVELDLGDVALARAGAVEGRLLDAEGAPVVGGLVRLEPDAAGGAPPRSRRAKSGAGGAFLLRDVPAGAWNLAGAPPGGAADPGDALGALATEQELGPPVPVHVQPGVSAVRDVHLEWAPPPPAPAPAPTGTVAGTLLGPDGTPLSGRLLRLEPLEDGLGSHETKSEDEGLFTFYSVRPGRYRVVVPDAASDEPRVEAVALTAVRADVHLVE